jgi:eukaryotic-like serine/threonine-protein kinase
VTEPNRLDEVVGGKYRIVRFLASGGMGSVYEAQHKVVRRRFAVKFLHQELALRRELLTRFQREAEAAGALESENVAAAVDFGIAADGAPYIVLEYLVGESLEHLLEREERLPVARATNLVQQACRGVQAAHAAGIVHRDLKPHNLFVCRREDGTDLVKVLDFGVAKLEVLEKSGTATRTGTVLGTPSYMSPEQARGEKNVDHLSDVYALGAIAYELLSGKKPHPGESHNAILHHIATQPALPLAQALPSLPEALVAVVERALADDPAARPTSAEDFALSLAPWSQTEVWPAPKLEVSAPRHAEPSSTLLAAEPPTPSDVRQRRLAVAQSGSPPAPVAPETAGGAEVADKGTRTASSERSGRWFAIGGGLVLVAVVLLLALSRSNRSAEPRADAPREPETAGVAAHAPAVKVVDVTANPPPAEPPAVPAPAETSAASARPLVERPTGRPLGRPPAPPVAIERPKPIVEARAGVAPVTFDQKNPY